MSMAVKQDTNPTYVRMSQTTQERLAVLSRVHHLSKQEIVANLVERAFQSAQQSGKLEQWLQSLAGLSEEEQG